MIKFLKNNIFATVVAALLLSGITYGAVIPGAMSIWRSKSIGQAATGVAGLLAAVTDTGSLQTITTGILPINIPGRITATSGGTAADIKAIQVIVTGTDPNDLVITETLPVFTENNATTVTGVKVFKKVTSITLPVHDGTLATTSLGGGGAPAVADADGIMSALTDDGATATITTGVNINIPDVPRNITATSGGTSADIKAIQVVLAGLDAEGNAIAETLPIFTVNTATTVLGDKAFAQVTSITIPAHDGTGATTRLGFGDKLGIGERLSRNTVNKAYLANTVEGTAPTVVIDADDIESNTADLNSALDSTQVILEYIETPQ